MKPRCSPRQDQLHERADARLQPNIRQRHDSKAFKTDKNGGFSNNEIVAHPERKLPIGSSAQEAGSGCCWRSRASRVSE